MSKDFRGASSKQTVLQSQKHVMYLSHPEELKHWRMSCTNPTGKLRVD